MPLARILVPPPRIDASGQETNHERAVERFLPCLPYPCANGPAIGRIHENLARPGFTQSVIGPGKEAGAFRIVRTSARIEREAAEDVIQLVK